MMMMMKNMEKQIIIISRNVLGKIPHPTLLLIAAVVVANGCYSRW